jgi:glycosyltransferase involved in cell wall biosynthesis
MCKESDVLIAVSNWMKKDIRRTFALPRVGTKVIYGGIESDATILDRNAVLRWRSLLAPRGEKIVMYAGRVAPEKGLPTLLASAALVCDRLPNVTYVIAGGPKEAIDQLRARIDCYKVLKGKIAFVGWLREDNLFELRHAVDIAVIPSLVETFGFSALEAMSASLPVIAMNVGGLREVVAHNETGLLVPCVLREKHWSRNISRLACAQRYLLENTWICSRFAKAAKERVLGKFSLNEMGRQTISAYAEAKKGRSNLTSISP